MKAKDIERISKALGDPNRLKIVQEVQKQKWMQCCDVCNLVQLAQPSVSHHLKQLIDAGVLLSEKEGRNIKYSIDKENMANYSKFINSLKS